MEHVTINHEIKEILTRLAKLQTDVDYVKNHIKDEDLFLTTEEEGLLKESYEHEEKGVLLSASHLRKELKL